MTPEQRKEYETLLHYLDRQTGTQICKEAAQAIRELMAVIDKNEVTK